jgi:ATP-dependent DNA ligase
MLLTELVNDAKIMPYFENDEWVAEQKMDGTRVLLRVTRSTFSAYQRNGGRLAHTAATQHLSRIFDGLGIMREMMAEGEEVWLDGELIIGTGEYRVFDLPSAGIAALEIYVVPALPDRERRFSLVGLANVCFTGPVSIVERAVDTWEKTDLYLRAEAAGVEGVVLKHRDAPYQPGARSTDWLKIKFVKTADVVVTAVSRPDPRHGSIAFAAYAEDGVLIQAGACSAIGKPPVAVGDVIEVAFLYWTGSTTYQPRMVRVREDKEAGECLMSQFRSYTRVAV